MPRALRIDDRAGSLVPGKQADVIVVRAEPFGPSIGDAAAHLILQASRGDVSDVFVAGRPRKRDGRLVDADLPRLRDALDATRAHLLEARLAAAHA